MNSDAMLALVLVDGGVNRLGEERRLCWMSGLPRSALTVLAAAIKATADAVMDKGSIVSCLLV